jgi:uncharacterized protein YraI
MICVRRTTFCWCFLTLLVPLPSLAQDKDASGFHGVAFRNVRTFQATSEARGVVNKIMGAIGIDRARFQVLESPDVNNAAAWIKGNQRIIAYNKRFMSHILQSSGRNYYSLIGIMAHEIGHHLAGHTVEDLANREEDDPFSGLRNALEVRTRSSVRTVGNLAEMRADELEADRFSGYILNKLGATAEDAMAWVATVPDPGPNSTHPRPYERTDAILSGWQRAGSPVTTSSIPRFPNPTEWSNCHVAGAPDDLKIRSGAGTSFSFVYAMPPSAGGVQVQFGNCQMTPDGEKWCFVRYQSYQGWSNTRFLSCGVVGVQRNANCDVVGVLNDLKIRDRPSVSSGVVFAMPPGARGVRVDFESCRDVPGEGRWCSVQFQNYSGWSNSRHLGNCH